MSTMPPNQGTDPKDAQMSTRVPARMKSAGIDLAHELNGKDPYLTVRQSDVLRWSYYRFLLDRWNELPDEVVEDLNREYLEKEVEDMPTLNKEGSSEVDQA